MAFCSRRGGRLPWRWPSPMFTPSRPALMRCAARMPRPRCRAKRLNATAPCWKLPAYVSAFTAAAYVKQMVEAQGEPTTDVDPPHFDFSTPQDALKGFVACLDAAAVSSPDDTVLLTRIREAADACLTDLLSRKGRFTGLGSLREYAICSSKRRFQLNGFDDVPGAEGQAAGDDRSRSRTRSSATTSPNIRR